MDTKTIGKWSLVVGIAIALINAFVELEFLADFPLAAILGLVAGILYLSPDDATGYYILTAAVATLGGSLGDFFGAGQYVTDWMAGSAVVLGAGAVALMIRTFVSWATP
jgi:hypothetical protein